MSSTPAPARKKTEKRGKCSDTVMNVVHRLLKQIMQTAVDHYPT